MLAARPLRLCSGPAFLQRRCTSGHRPNRTLWPEMVAADLLEPPHQANGWLGQVGKVVSGQAGNLEVRDLVQVATVLSAQRHVMGQVKIHAASINERGLGLVVTGVVAHAQECVVDGVGGAEEEPTDASQS